MKITIFELLGMIKDGKAPKKIKVTGTIYYFDEEYGFYFTKTKKGNVALGGKLNEINLIYNFNSENTVEILDEEKKIPEKLNDILHIDDLIPPVDENMYKIWTQTIKNQNKINEIIDCLDYLKSKGE